MTDTNTIVGSQFKVGDHVRWQSQSRSYATTKTGKIIAVVPAGADPMEVAVMETAVFAMYDLKRFANGANYPRPYESYIVAVQPEKKAARNTRPAKPRLYWPRTCHLERIES